jgi:hypothetical protein
MKFKQYVWYNRNAKINSPDTVHQILSLGRMEDIENLKKILGEEKIKFYFLQQPKKVYIRPILNFTKNYILRIKESIDENQYLKNTSRYIGSK